MRSVTALGPQETKVAKSTGLRSEVRVTVRGRVTMGLKKVKVFPGGMSPVLEYRAPAFPFPVVI